MPSGRPRCDIRMTAKARVRRTTAWRAGRGAAKQSSAGACAPRRTGLRALAQRKLDGRHRTDDALVVGDLARLLVLRHVEVDTHQHALVLDIDVVDRRLVQAHGRHLRLHGHLCKLGLSICWIRPASVLHVYVALAQQKRKVRDVHATRALLARNALSLLGAALGRQEG